MGTKIQRGVAAAEVVGIILLALRDSPGPAGLKQLSDRTGLSTSRLHHYLVSLEKVGLASLHAKGLYGLGTFALELGLVAADHLDFQHASAPLLRQVTNETGQSSFFSVGTPRGPLVIRWEQGELPLPVHERLGQL